MPRIELSAIGGIVLDAVGTLIEPYPSVADAYVEAARRQGLGLDRRVVRERFHAHFADDEMDETRGALGTDELTERRRWRRIVANVLPEAPDPERAFDELWDHFGRAESWRCFADVGPALNGLAEAGVALVIASNFDGRLRGVVAGLPALSSRPEPLVISSEVGYRKPHPAFYEAALASLGLSASRVLCVGDDVANDYRGPLQAGIRAVLIDREGRQPADVPAFPSLRALTTALLGSRQR